MFLIESHDPSRHSAGSKRRLTTVNPDPYAAVTTNRGHRNGRTTRRRCGIRRGGSRWLQFWDIASKGPVVTSTPDHELCAVGIHTLQMEAPSDTCTQEIGEVLSVLGDLGYVRESDVARIPIMPRPSTHVVYAPLSNAPVAPDVIMLFADARHSLVITEAVEQIEEGLPPALGRPACAAIPQAINSGRAALSLGCCGARAYLDGLRDEVAIWAIPGDKIAVYADRIKTLAHANQVLTQFHARRREDIESGARPTVQESLARLS